MADSLPDVAVADGDHASLPSVTVVVATCQNPGPLERCVRSILSCDYDDLEVIVVETMPRRPDTARMLLEQFPGERRVRYVESTASVARNAGLGRAEGEIVAFTEDDVVVDPLWLRASVEALLGDRSVGCVTGRTLPLTLESNSQLSPAPDVGFRNGFRLRAYRPPEAWEQNPLPTHAAHALGSGVSFVMPTDLARELAGFDPVLGRATPAATVGEDLDLLTRLLRRGHTLSWEPRAIVWHEHPAGSDRVRRQVFRHGVAMGATLGKHLIAGPERRGFLRMLPPGLRHLRVPATRRNAGKPANYPRHLAWLERVWILIGPIAYIISALTAQARRLTVTNQTSPRRRLAMRRIVVDGSPIDLDWFGEPRASRVRFACRPATERDGGPVPARVLVRQPAQTRAYLSYAFIAVPPLAAVVLWIVSLPHIDPRAMTDLGLISVLPVTFVLALVILTVSFVVMLHRQRLRTWALAAHVLALVAFVHATPAIVYGTLRYAWAWKHVGIVDYIVRHGSVNPAIAYESVYHNWPGFFAFVTVLIKVAGLRDALALATWGPVFNNVMFLGALLFLFSGLTRDRRIVWLACWLFFIANWVGQDYFSPQAFAFTLYLLVLGVVVRWLGPRSEAERPGRAVALGLVVLLLAVIAPTHALTSVMACIALTALVLTRVSKARALPFVALAFTVFWDLVFAVDFASHDLGTTLREINLPWDTTNSSLTNVGRLSPDQALVANLARGLSLIVILIAAAGVLRQIRTGKVTRAAVVLAVAPVVLFGTGSYDGEILFRIYLFAVPFLAFLGAHALIGARRRWLSLLATAGVTTLVLGLFLVAYYGKERINYFTPQEVAAARYVDTHAPPGSLLVDMTLNYPFAFKNYERFTYDSIALDPSTARARVLAAPAMVLSNWIYGPSYRDGYVLITRSQKIEAEADGAMPAGSIDAIERALLSSPRFRVVFRNRDAIVFSRAGWAPA